MKTIIKSQFMKKPVIGVIIIFLAALAMQSAAAEPTNLMADIEISLISQEPDPIGPGSYVELRFKIENYGFYSAEDVEIEILPKFPFSLDPGEDAINKIGTIGGKQRGAKAYTFDYKIRVDSNAVEGENEIELRWRTQDNVWVKETFNVDVQTAVALLSIKEFSSDPLRIRPGEVAHINMTLWNSAHSFMRDIKIKLTLIKMIQTATILSYEELPFSPVGSSEEKIISKIDGRSEETIVFDLVAHADAEAKIYKIPVTISYYDSTGASYNQTNIISLIIGDEPDMVVGIDKSEIYKAGQTGMVTVKFINKGFSDIKFLYAKLKPSDNYKILSSEDVYIGNIDSDDYETAEFNIYLNKGENGYVRMPLEIEFKDANNVEYEKTINLRLKLLTEEEAKLTGLKKSNPTAGIIITLVIVIVGFLGYRRFKKRKKKLK